MGRGVGILALAFSLAGCGKEKHGDGNENPNERWWDCSLAITMGGEVTETLDADDPIECSVTYGSDYSIGVMYLPEGTAPRFDLEIRDVTEGEVGTFSTLVQVLLPEFRTFVTTGCTVTLRELEFVFTEPSDSSRVYRAVGSGSCAGAAVESGGAGQITLSDFEFLTPAIWGSP